MTAWHDTRRGDCGLRALGVLLCALAWLAIARLAALHIPPRTANPVGFLLAVSGFLAASSGSALAMLGRHLFETVEVGPRWRRADGSNLGGSYRDLQDIGGDAGHHAGGGWELARAGSHGDGAGPVRVA